jgi:hypothetical protein
MWNDAATNVDRSITVKYALGPLVNYERGVALDDAEDRDAALFRLRRFLRSYDMPPAAHRGLVEDAKKRLARLEATDAAARKTVAPR